MLRFLVVGVVALSTAPLARPAPKDKAPVFTAPSVGQKCTYRIQLNDNPPHEHVSLVLAVDRLPDGVVRVQSGYRVGEPAWGEVEYTSRGIFIAREFGFARTPPEEVLRFPVRAGDTWDHQPDAVSGKQQAKATYTVGSEEEVEVPAGRFRAIPVVRELTTPAGKRYRQTIWRTPGVGIVKVVTRIGKDHQTQVLTAFATAKK